MRVASLPATVFKILGMTIVFMILFDTTLVLVDTVTVHSRMTTITGVMQNEVARNNCMPDELGAMFTEQLNSITERSSVAEGHKSNIDGGVVIDGTNYTSIREGEATGVDMVTGMPKSEEASYGDMLTMVVGVKMNPRHVYFRGSEAAQDGQGLVEAKENSMEYTLVYEYTVPCLRYTR